MKLSPLKKLHTVFFFLVSSLLLFAGFYLNFWKVAEQTWFDTHQVVMQSFIAGRMVLSRQAGIFSYGGLTGIGSPDATPPDIENANYTFQYQAYRDDLTFKSYSAYESQIGGQGMLFGILDSVLPLPSNDKLVLFSGLTALLSALILAVVLQWFFRTFSPFVGWLVLLSTVLSQWLVVFGRNLWWSPWAFYLPMAIMIFFMERRRKSGNNGLLPLGGWVFLAIFLKCFVNGYEYITTALVMMTVPFIYYAVADRLAIRRFLRESLVIVCASLFAILISMAILCIQIASVEGSLQKGIDHIVFSMQRRTYADAQDFPADYAPSLNAGTLEVVVTYLKGVYVDLNNYFPDANAFLARYILPIRYAYLILAYGLCSLLLFFLRQRQTPSEEKRRDYALLAATWFSVLAPLSWFIIFKAHSFVHTHMNFIVWQMPFTLFGFAVCAMAIQTAVSAWKNHANKGSVRPA